LKKIFFKTFKCIAPTLIISIIFGMLCSRLSEVWFIKAGFGIIAFTGIVSIIALSNRMIIASFFINISTLIGLSFSANTLLGEAVFKDLPTGFTGSLILIPLLGLIVGFIFEVIYQVNRYPTNKI